MRGKVDSGDLCMVAPVQQSDALAVGDIVLCSVRGAQYLHLIKALNGNKVLIGNNVGGTNGWTPRRQIYGRLIENASK